MSVNFASKYLSHTPQGSLACREIMGRRLYFSSEGRRATDSYRPQKPIVLGRG